MNQKNMLLGLTPSAIRDPFEYAKKRKLEIGDDNVFDFSLGNPSIPVPQKLDEILIDLLKHSEELRVHSYTSSAGDLAARNRIAEHLQKTYSANVKGEHIFMTCGAAAALAISFNALLEEGDEAILFAPYFTEYKVFLENIKVKVAPVKPNEKDFTPDLDDLKKKINEKTRLVLVNSPNNPTGVLYKEDTIKKIAEILKEKEKEYNEVIYLLSDEPYRELIYIDEKYPFVTNYYDDSIITYSFAKCLSIPGERIGYIAVGESCKDVKNVFASISGAARSLGYVCAPSLFQQMAVRCQGLTVDVNDYKTNSEILYEGLTKIGYEVIRPEGAFYIFIKALEEDDKKFALKARDFEIMGVPSSPFGYPGYIRISYCVKKETIERSLPAFEKLYKSYQGK